MSTKTSTQINAASEFKRPHVNFDPSIWGTSFLQYASDSMDMDDNELQKVHQLREDVKEMFVSLDNNIAPKLNLIDSIQRLGVSYHFEQEIEEALVKIRNICTSNNKLSIQDEDDLHSLALLFRLLRQQRYPISSDVFNKFKKENREFKDEVAKDAKGMLALYEAAQLRTHGEDVLDEALHFTYTHMKSLTNNNQLSPSLAAHVNHCLSQPLHKRLQRTEARYFMSFYQQDPSHSHILLSFAKLDFNMLQQLHQKEVGNISRWWKELDWMRRVPYARERFVECYIWCVGMSYEPQYSTARMLLGKLNSVITLVDDTYDAYGTLQELQLFTEAVHRWDISPITSLPECMKGVFEAIVEVLRELELVTTQKGTSFAMPYFKRAICSLSEAYLVETKWRSESHIPSYDEYKRNGVFTSTYPYHLTLFYGLGNFVSEEVLYFIFGDSKIIRAMSLISRLVDDIASHKFEGERGFVVTGVECCMKQYGISEKEAYKILHNDVESCWKDINEECLRLEAVPQAQPVLDFALNLARVIEVVYENFQDGFSKPKLLKPHIASLLLDPIHD